MKLYQRQFSFFDKDGDGKINAKELLQTLRALGRSASEATAKALIGDVDLDHDGVVNFSEFCRILEKNKAEGVDDVGIRKAFDHFRGGAEGISPEGLARVISEMGEKMSEEDIQEIFEAADTNNVSCRKGPGPLGSALTRTPAGPLGIVWLSSALKTMGLSLCRRMASLTTRSSRC